MGGHGSHNGAAIVKQLKHEGELFKAALLAGVQYAEGRGAVQFEATDSASAKALYVYRLLVHDKLIAPMPEDQVGEKTIRHRLATWYAHLPKGQDRKSTRLNSSHLVISYAVFCLK